MFNLTGKTALVTGATGGIGGAVARALHAQGATVVLSGTREAVLQDLAKELGERAFAAAANLSDGESVDGLIGRAEEAAGAPLDILVANAGNYAASKAGMIGFSKSLAQEVGSRGITVNCIAPGFIASPMTDVLNDQQRETILKNIPAGRLGTGDEIAAAAVYLSSDEAAYVTGQTLHVNGGMAMI